MCEKENEKIFEIKKVERKLVELFGRIGYTNVQCKRIVDIIIMAELYGIKSHGIQRVDMYIQSIKKCEIDPRAKYKIVYVDDMFIKIDANKQIGQLVSYVAMERAIELAKQRGIGFCSVQNSTNFGMAGYYTKMASKKDFIGVCISNTPPACMYPNSRCPVLGTNPLSVCIPADPTDFLLDMSTTTVTMGKLEICKKKDNILPEGWVIDDKGKSVLFADDAIKNILGKTAGLVPLGGNGREGGYKGAGLGLLIEILLTIAANSYFETASISHLFCVLDYKIFGEKDVIKRKVSDVLRVIRNSKREDFSQDIYTHGQAAEMRMRENIEKGITINEQTLDKLSAIFSEYNLKFEED